MGAAVVAGLVTGLLARLLMRLVTIATDALGEFGWAGTAGIVNVFVVVALPGAVPAAATRQRWRWLLLAAGAAFLLLPTTSIALADLRGPNGFSAGQWAGALGTTAGIHLGVAALPLLVLRLVDSGR